MALEALGDIDGDADDVIIGRRGPLYGISDPTFEPSVLKETSSAVQTLHPEATIDRTPTRATEPQLAADRITSPPEGAEKVTLAATPVISDSSIETFAIDPMEVDFKAIHQTPTGDLEPHPVADQIPSPPEEAEKIDLAAIPSIDTMGIDPDEFSEEELTGMISLLYTIRDLVNELLSTYSDISANKQRQMDHLKKDYENANHEASRFIRMNGYAGLGISGASIVTMAIGFFVPAGGKDLCDFLAKQMPTIGTLATTQIDSRKHDHDARAQLDLNDLQAKASSAGQKDDSRLFQLLEVSIALLKSAAQSGG